MQNERTADSNLYEVITTGDEEGKSFQFCRATSQRDKKNTIVAGVVTLRAGQKRKGSTLSSSFLLSIT